MKWFVIGWVVTLFWGNGAVEEGRTQWAGVFYGTAEQCAAEADWLKRDGEEYWARRSQDPWSERKDTRHGIQPQRYNGGVRDMNYLAGLCLPFESLGELKAAFPESWEGWPGTRVNDEGQIVSFAWWEGAEGEVFDVQERSPVP